jgi:TP901 family phage tail tape measure protein
MNIGTLTVTLGADLTGLDQMTKGLNTMAQRLRTFGYLSSITLTTPMVMAGKAAFNMAKDFEYSIQKIVGLAGVAQESVNKWREAILKMSPEVAQTPQALADALYFIASSGIKGAEALDVLRSSALAAKAGLGETKVIADFLTSALNAYKGTGLTAAYATEVLVAGVREGKAEATGFASAMGSIIPIASHLGVTLDQVSGALASITLTGSTAAQAATYLKSLFSVLAKKDDFSKGPGADALKSLNTSYGELRKILASGPDGLMNLMKKFSEMQATYGDTLVGKVIPNIRGMSAVFSLAGKNFQYNTELMKRVTNSHGALADAVRAVSNTLKVQLDTAIAKANVSLIEFGKSIGPSVVSVLNYLVGQLEKLTKWWSSLSEEQQKHKLKILAIVAAMGPLSLIISTTIYAVSGLITVIKVLTTAWLSMFRVVSLTQIWGKIQAGFQGIVYGAEAAAGAFSATAVAAENMATILAVSAASILGVVAAVLIFIAATKPIRDEIKSMKAQIAEMKEAHNYASETMKLQEKLSKMLYSRTDTGKRYAWQEGQKSNITKMSNEELSEAQAYISQILSIERDKLRELENYGKKEIENEKIILEEKKKLAFQELLLEEAKRKLRLGLTTREEFDTWKTNILGQQRIIKGTINGIIQDRKEEIEYDKTAIQGNIDFYTKLQTEIKRTQDIREAYRQAVENDIAAENALQESQTQGALRLAEAWAEAGNSIDFVYSIMQKAVNKDLWTAMLPSKEKDILQKNPDMLQRSSVGGFFKNATPKLNETKPFSFMPSMSGANKELSNILENLGKNLDYVNKKEQAVGITIGRNRELFDAARARLNAYSYALEDMLQIKPSEWNAVWQEEFSKLMSEMEKTQDVFDKMESRKDMWNTLTGAITSFLSPTMEDLKHFDQFLKSWVASVIQSFERLVAEIVAKKLVKVIMNLVSMGSLGAQLGNVGSTANLLIRTLGKGFAQGGTVPGGYPNDTYPALLSSGETVLPKGLNIAGTQHLQFEPVEIVIKDNTLTGFLKKANTRKSLY